MLNKENEANVLTIAFGHILYILNPVLGEFIFFFFNDTAPTEIYTSLHTLSLHDALPISAASCTSRCSSWGNGSVTSRSGYFSPWEPRWPSFSVPRSTTGTGDFWGPPDLNGRSVRGAVRLGRGARARGRESDDAGAPRRP